MKVLVFSDIHGNLPAFELMLKNAGSMDAYVSLGDVVGYGPWSNECVKKLQGLKNCIKILGNHEEYFLKNNCDDTNELTKLFFHSCSKNFTDYDSIEGYKKREKLGKYILTHMYENKYLYPDSVVSLDNNYIIGHSHHQFSIKSNGYILLSPGSVGQNRKYINVINYMVLNLDKDSFEMKQITYDVVPVINEMKKRGYPKECIAYYENKPKL